jgi:hypothetical protein
MERTGEVIGEVAEWDQWRYAFHSGRSWKLPKSKFHFDTCTHLDTCMYLNELEVWEIFEKYRAFPRSFVGTCIKLLLRKQKYLAILKFVENATLIIISRWYCWCGHILCVFVHSSRYGTKGEVRFNLGRFRHKHEGNSKTSRTRVSELNVINNPLAASDRTVIGLLNSHRRCQIHAGI